MFFVLVPELVRFQAKSFHNAGSKFKLLCYLVKGTKPFEFEWLKNQAKVTNDGFKYKIETEDDESQFTILKLDPNDTGNYSCHVRNDFGDDTQYTFLFVQGLTFWNFVFVTKCGA